jgi:hypothetical protein
MICTKTTHRKTISYPSFHVYRDPPPNPTGDLRRIGCGFNGGSGRQVVLSPAQDLAADAYGHFPRTVGIVSCLFSENNRV